MIAKLADRMQWLARLAASPDVGLLSMRIAVALSITYINSETGTAWPSVGRLAEELRASRRGVQKALNRLIETGWLRCAPAGGRRKTNEYQLRIPKGELASSPFSKKGERRNSERVRLKQRTHGPKRANAATVKSELASSPEPWRNQRKKPGTNEGEPRASARTRTKPPEDSLQSQGKKQASTSHKKTSVPEGWQLSNEELSAAATLAGWRLDRAEQEFEKFADYHKQRDSRLADWSAAWRSWCRRGQEFDVRRKPKRNPAAPEPGIEATVSGLNSWLHRESRNKNGQ